jgi:hypothetical protein
LTGSGCGRPHCALVEFGFPFLKKGGCLGALGLGLGDVSAREPAWSRASFLRACISTVPATRESRSTTGLCASDADLHRVGAIECSARFLGASGGNTDAGFADRDLFWAGHRGRARSSLPPPASSLQGRQSPWRGAIWILSLSFRTASADGGSRPNAWSRRESGRRSDSRPEPQRICDEGRRRNHAQNAHRCGMPDSRDAPRLDRRKYVGVAMILSMAEEGVPADKEPPFKDGEP